MLKTDFRPVSRVVPPSAKMASRREEIEALHRKCGIYTKPDIAARILDAIGWRASAKLFQARLLEPSAGNGEFVVEAATRLILACQKHGLKPSAKLLGRSICAFEIHSGEAEVARERIRRVLQELDVHSRTATALASSWIITGDFLLAELTSDFTHVVGNPPYIRWAKIPSGLKSVYQRTLARELTGGDIFIPFLDRSLALLVAEGRCGFLCSDRWRYAAFAEGFRTKWLPKLEVETQQDLLAVDAFKKEVDTYPAIFVAKLRTSGAKSPQAPSVIPRKTLIERGYVIKVGPALGCSSAFVLDPDEADIEEDLLFPWIDSSEVVDGAIQWRGRRVAAMHESDGKLLDLRGFPLLKKRLKRFEAVLKTRAIVRNGGHWYQPIDRIRSVDWTMPKLLVPEIAKVPRVALDQSGAIPSHGIYAIFSPHRKIDTLQKELADGGLARALEGISPKIKGGYVRRYKRFLAQIRLS